MSNTRNSRLKGKVFLHKLEVYPEIKKELIEKFDFNVIGDQLGLEPEVEENIQKLYENVGSDRAAKEYLLKAKLNRLSLNWYEMLLRAFKSEDNGLNLDFCEKLTLSEKDFANYEKEVLDKSKLDGHHVVFEVKKAVINKLKTFKNAFGENCDVFSKSSFEVVPKIKEDKQFQSSHLQFADNSLDNPFVTLSQLIQCEESSYIGISGEAGSGKTFLTNIIARKLFEKDVLCLTVNLNQVNLTEELSLAEFFTQFCCVDLILTNEERKQFSDWLMRNQSRFVIVFDGLDQLSKDVDLNTLVNSFVTPKNKLTAGNWLTAIMSRQILTRTKLIVTSRPFAVTCLIGDLRPRKLFTLEGFTDEDIKKALMLYTEEETICNEIYTTIVQHDLFEIAYNPLSMFLLTKIIAYDHIDFESLTSFCLHATVFEKLYSTKNAQLDKDGNKKLLLIEKTCYQLLMKSKFVFSQKDLVEGLTLEDLEKYVMVNASVTTSSYKNSNDEKLLVFSHQLFQEYLAAKFVVNQCDLNYFKVFIKTFVFSQNDNTVMFWSTLRRFICTLLANGSSDLTPKRKFFQEKLAKTINDYLASYCYWTDAIYVNNAKLKVLNHLLLLSSDLEELKSYQNELNITCHLKTFEVFLHHSFLNFVEKFVLSIDNLIFHELPILFGPIEFLAQRLQNIKINNIDYWHHFLPLDINELLVYLKRLSTLATKSILLSTDRLVVEETSSFVESKVVDLISKQVAL